MKRSSARLASAGVTAKSRGPSSPTAWQVHPVEVVADLLVDVVFPRLVWLRDFQRRLLFRRRFAVVLVVVPSVADRFVAVHQHVEAAPLVAVEVLHAEAACGRPPTAAKSLRGSAKVGVGRTSATRPCCAEAVDEPLGGVRGRFVDEDGAAEPLECVGVGVGLQQRGAVAEVARRRAAARRGRGAASGGDSGRCRSAEAASTRSTSRWGARRRTSPGRAGRRRATAGCHRASVVTDDTGVRHAAMRLGL